MSTMRDSSREAWESKRTIEHINAGSLQRIADACELMAKNYLQLQSERDRYLNYWRSEQAERERLERSNAALRGVITKMRKAQEESA